MKGRGGHFAESFAWLRDRLEAEGVGAAPDRPPTPGAIAGLAETFGLSPFESDLLLLLLGVELDPRLRAAVRKAGAEDGCVRFDLALARLPESHWSAVAPTAPLRYWRMIEFPAGGAIVSAPLRIDERIMLHLLGVASIDARLVALVEPVGAPDAPLPPSQASVAAEMQAAAGASRRGGLQLFGGDPSVMADIASVFFEAEALEASRLRAAALPEHPAEIAEIALLWTREAALARCGLIFDALDLDDARDAARRFLGGLAAPVVVLSASRRDWPGVGDGFEVRRPRIAERAALWREVLGPDDRAAAAARRLAHDFVVEAHDIRAIASRVATDAPDRDRPSLLWDASRRLAASRAVDGVSVSRPEARLADLALPVAQKQVLNILLARMRNRAVVHDDWGFDAESERGSGVSALFAGPSGTGKTFAAEVIASELGLDLHRIDVSSVVNKYIGETEKSLRRIFDAAEAGGAVLLFDEADALFGKRGEVRDSHDRYANIGVSYLLQRLETYRGLSILTTNLKDNIDRAFLRRFTYLVEFPFPDAETRAAMWRLAFSPATPVDGLDPEVLARLAASGAEIRNIAIGAAFIAANESGPVTMERLRRAAAAEMEKAGRKLTLADLGGWS